MYFETFEKTSSFEGRSSREEYWVFIFCSVLLALPFVFIDAFLGMINPSIGIGPLTGLALFLMVIPSFALTVRRLHDIDLKGWWFFIQLVPWVGGLIMTILCLQSGTEGPNRFGSDPRAINSSDTENSA